MVSFIKLENDCIDEENFMFSQNSNEIWLLDFHPKLIEKKTSHVLYVARQSLITLIY